MARRFPASRDTSTCMGFIMKRILLCSTLLAATTSTAALAGEWTGWYAGGQLGYSYGEFDLESVTDTDNFDTNGIIGGFMVQRLSSMIECMKSLKIIAHTKCCHLRFLKNLQIMDLQA